MAMDRIEFPPIFGGDPITKQEVTPLLIEQAQEKIVEILEPLYKPRNTLVGWTKVTVFAMDRVEHHLKETGNGYQSIRLALIDTLTNNLVPKEIRQ